MAFLMLNSSLLLQVFWVFMHLNQYIFSEVGLHWCKWKGIYSLRLHWGNVNEMLRKKMLKAHYLFRICNYKLSNHGWNASIMSSSIPKPDWNGSVKFKYEHFALFQIKYLLKTLLKPFIFSQIIQHMVRDILFYRRSISFGWSVKQWYHQRGYSTPLRSEKWMEIDQPASG